MIGKNRTKSNRKIRHFRLRKKVVGTGDRPRLCVSPSLKQFTAQIINDFEDKTIIGGTTKAKEFRKISKSKVSGNVQDAAEFGKFFAHQAKAKGIEKVVFDRGGYLYHGRVKAFADAARAEGLLF